MATSTTHISPDISIFSEEILNSIKDYTGQEYQCINGFLRTNGTQVPDGCDLNLIQTNIENIDKAFLLTKPLENSITVFRGVRKKEYIKTKSFMSTSTDKDTALSFAVGKKCCMLVITVPAGSQVLDIAQISSYKAENEILLPRNSELTVINNIYNQYEEMEYIYLTYVPIQNFNVTDKTTASIAMDKIKDSSYVHKVNEVTKENILKLIDDDESFLYESGQGEDWYKSIISSYEQLGSYEIKENIKNEIIEILNQKLEQ